MSVHVPAWKRLGLKLRNAPELPPALENQKRKRETEQESAKQVKKSKHSEQLIIGSDSPHQKSPISPRAKKQKKVKALSHNIIEDKSNGDQQPLTTPKQISKQKSVTFTPETKAEDGDSVKQLFNSWVAEQKSKDPGFVLANSQPAFDTPEAPQVTENVDTTLAEPGRRVKRTKVEKSKKEKKSKVARSTAARPARIDSALNYLNQFCTSRSTWKFHKIHQIDLLKNVYNSELLPSTSIEQFYTYVRDMKGQSRTLLRDSALKVKVQDKEAGEKGFTKKISNPAAMQVAYDAAIDKYVADIASAKDEAEILAELPDPAMRPRMVKRMRAERILADLSQDSSEAPRTLDTEESTQNGKPVRPDGKTTRRRKQRTAIDVSSDSDSSTNSSSDSDSDSGSESDNAPRTPSAQIRAEAAARRTPPKASSSSDSDSTDSSTDSDSSSDSE